MCYMTKQNSYATHTFYELYNFVLNKLICLIDLLGPRKQLMRNDCNYPDIYLSGETCEF